MYAELIIGLNMLFNYVILSFAKKIGNVQVRRGRLLIASLLGAIPVTLFPISILAVILSFLAMTVAAFGKVFSVWRNSAVMVVVGALFAGGLLTAFQYRIETPSGSLAVLIYAILAYVALYMMKNKWLAVKTAQHMTELMSQSTLTLWDSAIPITVFVDSGNHCTEPLSGAPVHFIAFTELESFMPEELKKSLASWNTNESPSLTGFPTAYLKDLRLIRLLTVQGWSWAVGLKYDHWQVEGGDLLEKGYIVVTKEDNRYPEGAGAILHVSAMEMINKKRGAMHVA